MEALRQAGLRPMVPEGGYFVCAEAGELLRTAEAEEGTGALGLQFGLAQLLKKQAKATKGDPPDGLLARLKANYQLSELVQAERKRMHGMHARIT